MWIKKTAGYATMIAGWALFSYLVPHDLISWTFVEMFAVAILFQIASSILDSAKFDLWPWDVSTMLEKRRAQR
jgi:hypothetical protein